LEASEAAAVLEMTKEEIRTKERKELLKTAKKAVRDVLLRRCACQALGLDCRQAIINAAEAALKGLLSKTFKNSAIWPLAECR
jgi:hypothetical protein